MDPTDKIQTCLIKKRHEEANTCLEEANRRLEEANIRLKELNIYRAELNIQLAESNARIKILKLKLAKNQQKS